MEKKKKKKRCLAVRQRRRGPSRAWARKGALPESTRHRDTQSGYEKVGVSAAPHRSWACLACKASPYIDNRRLYEPILLPLFCAFCLTNFCVGAFHAVGRGFP